VSIEEADFDMAADVDENLVHAKERAPKSGNTLQIMSTEKSMLQTSTGKSNPMLEPTQTSGQKRESSMGRPFISEGRSLLK
jgi:hypothetical protein